jgi:hypothetical protein
LNFRILDLIATVVACCEEPRETGPGHPPAETLRVLATLRQFLREGTPWRSLRATEDKASGSTLRRWLERWARDGVLARVHATLVAMLRGDPTLRRSSWTAARCAPSARATCPGRTRRTAANRAPSTTSRSPARASPSPASPRRPTSTTRSSSSACSWPPSPSWPGSRRCSPTPDRDGVRRQRLRRRASPRAVPRLRRRSSHPQARAAARLGAGKAALARRAQQRLGAGEQAPRPTLRPARLHRPIPAPDRMHTPGCRQARS